MKPHWTKKAALERMNNNQELQEACTHYPLAKLLERYSEALSHETHVTVRGIAWDRRADSEKGSMLATTALVDSAAKLERYAGYNRISCHYAYKDWMWAAIGHENGALWTCIDTIDDLLPPDAADLDEEGSNITSNTPALPGLPVIYLPPLPQKHAETATKNGKLVLLSMSELEIDSDDNEPDPRQLAMRTILKTLASQAQRKGR